MSGDELSGSGELPSPAELVFDGTAGAYVATVTDVASGEQDATEVLVGEPERLRAYARTTRVLTEGMEVSLGDLSLPTRPALSFRVLPGLDKPFKTLVRATAEAG